MTLQIKISAMFGLLIVLVGRLSLIIGQSCTLVSKPSLKFKFHFNKYFGKKIIVDGNSIQIAQTSANYW